MEFSFSFFSFFFDFFGMSHKNEEEESSSEEDQSEEEGSTHQPESGHQIQTKTQIQQVPSQDEENGSQDSNPSQDNTNQLTTTAPGSVVATTAEDVGRAVVFATDNPLLTRPARRQVKKGSGPIRQEITHHSSDYNIWYHKKLGDRFEKEQRFGKFGREISHILLLESKHKLDVLLPKMLATHVQILTKKILFFVFILHEAIVRM